MEFIEMKQKDIKPLKEKLWLRNNKKCPVLDKEIPLDKMALDHIHKAKNEEYSINKGVIRESLYWKCNSVLGKLENSLKRVGLTNEEGFDIGTFLRNAADYFDRGAYIDEDGNCYVHPNEVKKEPKVSKRQYNKCKKLYEKEDFVPKRKNHKKKTFPSYPKSGKLTKDLKKMFEKYDINPYLV